MSFLLEELLPFTSPLGWCEEGRQTVFFTPLNPFGDNPDDEEPSDDLLKPRKVYYHRKWKPRQDAVYWINFAQAQEKGLQFWQTRSHAIIVYNSVPADCIYKVISQKGERTLYERLSSPRPAPKIILKSAWQSQQQQDTSESSVSWSTRKQVREESQRTPTNNPERWSIWKQMRGTESLVEKEEPKCKVELRIEGIAQDVVLGDEERMGHIQKISRIIANWITYQINY